MRSKHGFKFFLFAADSIYKDAAHYWPLDNLNITSTELRERPDTQRRSGESWQAQVKSTVRDFKGRNEGVLFGDYLASQGVVNQSLQTDGKSAWANLSNFVNRCPGDPGMCPLGLTVALWIKYQVRNDSDLQYFIGTSGTREGSRGFLIFQDFVYDTEDHLAIKLENSTVLWKRSFSVPRDTWTHVVFTWDNRVGLVIYVNGSVVGSDAVGRKTEPLDVYRTTFTLGRPNDMSAFSKCSYDEIALWERKLHPTEIEAIFHRTAGIDKRTDFLKGTIRDGTGSKRVSSHQKINMSWHKHVSHLTLTVPSPKLINFPELQTG